MASKKRKKGSGGPDTANPIKKTRVDGVSTAPPGKDLIMSLPPELRNTIYELVLVSSEAIVIQERRPKKSRSRLATTTTTPMCSSWKLDEPSFLSCNKVIRQEASSIYYGMNSFIVEADIHRLDPTLKFIKRIASRVGAQPFGSFTYLIRPLKSVEDPYIQFLPLAEFFYQNHIRPNKGAYVLHKVALGEPAWGGLRFREVVREPENGMFKFNFMRGPGVKTVADYERARMLQELVELATVAGEKGWQWEGLFEEDVRGGPMEVMMRKFRRGRP